MLNAFFKCHFIRRARKSSSSFLLRVWHITVVHLFSHIRPFFKAAVLQPWSRDGGRRDCFGGPQVGTVFMVVLRPCFPFPLSCIDKVIMEFPGGYRLSDDVLTPTPVGLWFCVKRFCCISSVSNVVDPESCISRKLKSLRPSGIFKSGVRP